MTFAAALYLTPFVSDEGLVQQWLRNHSAGVSHAEQN
jgi:hypothetical protein